MKENSRFPFSKVISSNVFFEHKTVKTKYMLQYIKFKNKCFFEKHNYSPITKYFFFPLLLWKATVSLQAFLYFSFSTISYFFITTFYVRVDFILMNRLNHIHDLKKAWKVMNETINNKKDWKTLNKFVNIYISQGIGILDVHFAKLTCVFMTVRLTFYTKTWLIKRMKGNVKEKKDWCWSLKKTINFQE